MISFEPMLAATTWMTPFWLTAMGIAAGMILVLLTLLKIAIFSKIPGLNTIARNVPVRWILALVLAAAFTAIFLKYYSWRYGNGVYFDEHSALALFFVVPVGLFIGWGFWGLVDKDRVGDTFSLMQEGFLSWINIVVITMTVVAGLGFVFALNLGITNFRMVDEPFEMIRSIGRLPYAGAYETPFTVKPGERSASGEVFDIDFDGQEIRSVEILSDQKIEIATQPIVASLPLAQIYEVDATREPIEFVRRPDGNGRIPNEYISKLYISNLRNNDAHVTIKWNVEPVYKEVWIVPWAAFCVLMIYVLYLVFATTMPKVAAIALSTFKTEMSQPLYIIVMIIGLFFIAGSIWIPYNTFGEDIKMYKDSGLTLIRVLAIFVAIWAAGKSVAEEIEGRTALTVLSKPVGRRQFIFGKYMGICLAVAVMFIVLGLWFEMWTSYKPVYDARESSRGDVAWEECFLESTRLTPALMLTFLEVTIFVAISLAISTRFGILVNFLLCFAIYVLGHLTPLLVNSTEAVAAFEPVVLFGQIVAVIFPVLDHFDVQAAINSNNDVPMSYLGWSMIYTMLYGAMAMLLALVFFEDRDLA